MKKTSPWNWIPTLYIAEGLPYFAVNTLTVLMYTRMGIGKGEMALYTSWLYLPWVIKPFWSPFVDIIRTKRWWTIGMEYCLAISMAAVAFLLPTSFFFASTLAAFWLMAFFSATHDIAADGYYMLELSAHDQALYVGVRSTFYRIASIIGQGGLVVLAGLLETSSRSIPIGWSLTFGVLSVLFAAIAIYHMLILPRPASDKPQPNRDAGDILNEFGWSFVSFFTKPGILAALGFMLLYRFPEALCVKMVQPFLIDPVENGGLGLTTAQVGIANGTIGVIGLLAGGIIGGVMIARKGLKYCLWPMALALTLPCGLYCWLAWTQPQNFIAVCTAIGIEQFGYGFGFSAYMLYLIYFSQGENKTSHYAFCTAFMALGMMLPGMGAGWIYERLDTLHNIGALIHPGFFAYFCFVMVACLATFVGCSLVRIDPGFGVEEQRSDRDDTNS